MLRHAERAQTSGSQGSRKQRKTGGPAKSAKSGDTTRSRAGGYARVLNRVKTQLSRIR